MRSLQSLTAALAALTIATGTATPAIAHPTVSPKAASAPDTHAEDFQYWFDQCATADPVEALIPCQNATELAPDLAIAWDNFGAVLEQLGRYEDALTALDRALELTPEDGNIWYNVGVVLAKLRRYDMSVAAFDEAYRLNPEDEMARKFADLLRSQLGEY